MADAAAARKFIAVGYSMSGRFVQYLPLLAPDRVVALVIIAGAPPWAMTLPDGLIDDWAGRAGDRERLREIPAIFAVKPSPLLLDAYASDAGKASRHALASTLRMLTTSFEHRLKATSPAISALVLAGKADRLLGPDTQRKIADHYPNCKVVELDCGHEILIELPVEAATRVVQFVTGLG